MGKWHQKDKSETKECLCGCGTMILRWQQNLKERFYVYHHQPKTKPESYKEFHRQAWLGKNNPMWKGGITVKSRNLGRRTYPRIYEKIRKKILETNPLCEICSKLAVNIHHKDEDTYNNKLNNLQKLCRSCHTKAHLKF